MVSALAVPPILTLVNIAIRVKGRPTPAFQHKEYKGILCRLRLAHCFGRGLLIYTADVRPAKRDIIDVTLPLTP